ncbi:MAG TPA: hypothetical protein VGX92_01880 [Pyrinomonadaceae bacterium]|nr:hypothetical protein [Pyrinomonadaceae bacterium]
MKTHLLKRKYLLILCAVILVAVSVAGVLATRRALKREQQPQAKGETTLPLIISRVKNLEVIGATLERAGQPDAEVVLEIQNNSDLAVTALAIESGDEINSAGTSTYNDDDDGNPSIIIKPHGTITVRMLISNLIPDTALRVAGVTYADGTEDGDKSALGTIRGQRAHDKTEREARKGAKNP